MNKICNKCKLELDVSSFYKRSDGRGEYRHICKACHSTKCSEKFQRDKHKHRATAYKHALKTKYNLTLDEYYQIYSEQGGKCAICDVSVSTEHYTHKPFAKRAFVDHCHTTGKVRGILCNTCNTLLGMSKDSTDTLRKAIEYLDQRSSRI